MDFLDYALSLNPTTLMLPILGNSRTLDTYDRTVTTVGSPEFSKLSRNGYSVQFPYQINSRYEIDHGAEQFFTDLTVYAHFLKPVINNVDRQEIAAKWDTTGRAWLLQYYHVNELLRMYNSAGQTRDSSIKFTGYKSCAVRITGSTNMDFFFNGSLTTAAAGRSFATQPAAKTMIGGRYNTGYYNTINPLGCVAIFSYALTDNQIGNLNMSFERLIVTSRQS